MKVLILLVCAAVAFASDEFDDGQTCAEEYLSCRKDAELHDIKNIYQCGKNYAKCRAAPAVACVKGCHTTFLACRKANGILNRAQCYLDLAKCYTTCKIAPHHQDEEVEAELNEAYEPIVEDEDDEDEMDDGSGGPTTCVENYRECKAIAKSFKDKIDCGAAYLHCRGSPWTGCLRVCHVERKQCTRDADGFTQHAKCFKDFAKCAATCKLGPHNDELPEEDEGEDDLMMEDEDEMEDGSGGKQTCRDQYKECTKGDPSIKDRFRCGKEYLKCKAEPRVACAKKNDICDVPQEKGTSQDVNVKNQCHKERKMCTKNANTTREHWACIKAFPKCYRNCRKAPQEDVFEDEGEDDLMMEDEDDELDDGSGGKQTCREQYRECTKGDPSIADRLRCGKAYMKCKYDRNPHVNCAKKCHAERKDCSSKANGWKEKLACIKAFPTCFMACRKNQ